MAVCVRGGDARGYGVMSFMPCLWGTLGGLKGTVICVLKQTGLATENRGGERCCFLLSWCGGKFRPYRDDDCFQVIIRMMCVPFCGAG